MAIKKRQDAEKVMTVQAAVPVVVWRANRPMNEEQYNDLHERLRRNEEATGVKIMLVPHSVDVEVSAKLEETEQKVDKSEDISDGDDGKGDKK